MTLDPEIAARLKRNADGLFTADRAGTRQRRCVDGRLDGRRCAGPHPGNARGNLFFAVPREQWVKGATSGHTQRVHSVRLDCDGDAVLLIVDQVGGACHTGDHSCFDADVLLEADE